MAKPVRAPCACSGRSMELRHDSPNCYGSLPVVRSYLPHVNDAWLAGRALASLVLQISDIHTCTHQHMPYHRNRYEDFALFVSLAAPRIGPAAVVLTGDLVEGKSANTLYQHQYDWEWQAYRNVTDLLKSAAGPSCQVMLHMCTAVPHRTRVTTHEMRGLPSPCCTPTHAVHVCAALHAAAA